MPLHPRYGVLTGATRLRRGWLGSLIMEVELTDGGGWRKATEHDLKAIGFKASSEKARRQEKRAGHPMPPLDWTMEDIPSLKWP